MNEKEIIDKSTEMVEDTLRNTLDLIKKIQQELQAEKEKNKELVFRVNQLHNALLQVSQVQINNSFYRNDKKHSFISKDKIKEKLKELKDIEQELTDEQGYWGSGALQEKIELLEELLEEE